MNNFEKIQKNLKFTHNTKEQFISNRIAKEQALRNYLEDDKINEEEYKDLMEEFINYCNKEQLKYETINYKEEIEKLVKQFNLTQKDIDHIISINNVCSDYDLYCELEKLIEEGGINGR